MIDSCFETAHKDQNIHYAKDCLKDFKQTTKNVKVKQNLSGK